MLLRVLTLTLALTGAAVAQVAPDDLAEAISDKAQGCWSLLPSDYSPENVFELDVPVSAGGVVKGMPEVVSGVSTIAQGAISRAAQRAVVQCSPYPEARDFTGVVRITMSPKL
ncbi:hypothetical protein [Devosia sp.]|uniref:hypothetical protein n=1 Tax=Devosia sp. TaxID=1871048 RepID=UPI001AFCFD53|nr:hypothetical protein [Devosia sp.]MBO9589063.1 hypothetical protein [Devosia sp.]